MAPVDTVKNTHTYYRLASVSDSYVTKNENTHVLLSMKISKKICIDSTMLSYNPTLGNCLSSYYCTNGGGKYDVFC